MLHDMQDDIRKVGLRHASGDMGAWINAPKFKGFKQKSWLCTFLFPGPLAIITISHELGNCLTLYIII